MSSKKRGEDNSFARLHFHIKYHFGRFNHHLRKAHHHIRHHSRKIHGHIVNHFHNRKHIEYDDLPPWKKKVLEFNHKHLHHVEHIVEHMIPFLVLLLFFIVIAELSEPINGLIEAWFHTSIHSFELLGTFAELHHHEILLIDKIIIAFFVVELYFNFFKKAKIWSFIKCYFLDILAIIPLNWAVGLASREIATAQTATHVAVDTQRMASRSARFVKIARIFSRIPRLIRLYRLYGIFVPHKTPKHIRTKI